MGVNRWILDSLKYKPELVLLTIILINDFEKYYC